MPEITVKKLLLKLRIRLRDLQRTTYSDFALISALGDALRMLWIALAERFSKIPYAKVELTMTDGRAPLPEDFYTLVALPDGARVVGNEVESKGETVMLEYNRVPMLPEEPDEAVGVPLSLVLDLIEIAYHVAQGANDSAVEVAMNSATRISQKREYAAIPDPVPFP